MNGRKLIDRPPRIQPALPFGEHEIPRPPDPYEQPYGWLVQVAIPGLSIVVFVVGAVLGGGLLGALLIIPMAASVWAALVSYRGEKKLKAQIEQGYAERLVELNREMHNNHDMQRRAYHYNYPEPADSLRIVSNTHRESEQLDHPLRKEARLWERRASDADFGYVRLGIGTVPSTVTYELGSVDSLDNPQLREALKLQEDSRFVKDAPVVLALRAPTKQDDDEEDEQANLMEQEKVFRPPVTHALGIAGDSDSVYTFVRAMLGHYVVYHAPNDAQLYVLASDRKQWHWTEALPHCQVDEQATYHCFVREIKAEQGEKAFDDDDGGELEQFLEGIRKVLAQRKIRMQEHDKDEEQGDNSLPHLLLVVDLLDAINDPRSPLRNIEGDAAISILIEEGARLGATVIFLVPERSKIPSGCCSVLEIQETAPATNSRTEAERKLHFRFAEIGVNSDRYVGRADAVADLATMNTMADELSSLGVRQGFGANLAGAVPFLDLMEHSSLAELKAATAKKWRSSVQPEYANWLRVKLGRMSGNKPRTLVMSAKRDGVHGMVAGSTGSGKSELLISFIMGLAITYDPSVLNFVLVDYKGGSAFSEFKGRLPHCVDVITNLGEDGVTRMFTSVKAEMERRQRLNTETGTKNIVDYRQKGLHETKAPYPFLFIIIDEFAEMIAARAEYKTQLETITRLGRAQGVSLILAAQRPSGVTDQMRSNIKFRICLRVETAGESREMLRRSDAAYLPTGVPGRGYLQVGNEEIELVQMAYAGERYVDPSQAPTEKVVWLDRNGNLPLGQDQEPPELYVAIIDALNHMATEHGVPKQRAPWPDFLPRQLWLSQLLVSEDPAARTITSSVYLHEVDQITQGRPAEPNLTLNPSVNKWFTGGCGWFDTLDWDRYALRPVVGLVDNPYEAKQVPLVVDLPSGNALIVGASGSGKTTLIRTLVASLAASHSPDQFHAYLLDLGGRNLKVLEKLPHIGALIMPDEEGYQERVAQLLRELFDIVDKRKSLLNAGQSSDIYEYNRKHPDKPEPAILMAIDNFLEFKETFGGDLDDDDSPLSRFTALTRLAKPYGIHFLISINQVNDLPPSLFNLFPERFALKLADTTEYRSLVGESVAEIRDVPGRGYAKIEQYALAFQVATVVKPENEIARLLDMVDRINAFVATARPYRKPVRVDGLAKSVLYKDMLARTYTLNTDQRFISELKAVTQRRWAESVDPKHADWLKVMFGLRSGDHPRTLELEAKKDGVHGLIAGGTGAGKSELLMTMIVGLALNHDPSILNFLLVDYKGGGAFKPFADLPHVVDVITNLNKTAVNRVFTTISAEMQRRQKMNADTGTADIVEYRKKGLHLTHAPYPHLFIIIDEFAEMITDSPEFRDELDSITRVGRSAGVNLILAAQRPVGVSDQMRANIKLRICLRVEGIDTSREMLRRSDAAFLPNGMPGRGYIQVGNENIELVQAAYTGEPYRYADVPEGVDKPKFYSVIVAMTNELLQGERPRTPWPTPLPNMLTLADPLSPRYVDTTYIPLMTMGRTDRLALNPFAGDWLTGNGAWHGVAWNETAMRAVAGLLDDPHKARHLPLIIDFSRGHAVIFGAAGWGKTSFMRSLIVSLASTHSPDEFQAHVLDLGNSLDAVGVLPHVGTIIKPDEAGYEERVQQLWRELNDIVNRRRGLFNEAGVNTLYEYNHANPGRVEPALLVAIDNFAEYVETFGKSEKEDDPNNLLQAFVALARQGISVGVHFVITVTRLNLLNNKLYSLFTERLTLHLADADDYSGIVGSRIPDIDEIAGRGYTRVGKTPLAFQVALPPIMLDADGQPLTEKKRIIEMAKQMRAYQAQGNRTYQEPLRIGALPPTSLYRQVLARDFGISADPNTFARELKRAVQARWAQTASAEGASWLYAPLGIVSGNRIRNLRLEAKRDGVHGMVAGGTGAGKSELLMSLIVGLALNFSPDILNFILVDYKGGGAFKPFADMPHTVDIVTNLNKAGVDRMFTAINAEIRRRQGLNAETNTKDIVEYRQKGLHISHVAYPHLFIIIDEYVEMIDDNPDYRIQLESVTRVGRAQGVNLILASQQPKGVSDQMRANIKLRLCLRVEQADTSRELLRRPDAALLPNGMPGRGYLQIGNENLELIQVAWSGEEQQEDQALVQWLDHGDDPTPPSVDEKPRLFDTAVALTAELYGKMAPKPWPSFLPANFSLETALVDAKQGATFRLESVVTDWINDETDALWPGVDWSGSGERPAMRPIVGLLDYPAEARQDPLRFDLTRNHLAVFGDSGLGKSTLLRTLILSLAATHTPTEFQAYVLSLGGRSLSSLQELPHVGAVIYADEESFEERLQRLLNKLERMMLERQRVMSAADANDLYIYNTRFPEKALPAVLVVIDSFAELQENHDLLVETQLMPLIRSSLGAGISFVVTANITNSLPSKLYNLFSERITFRQSDTDRYMDIVGRGAVEFGDIPGRGYVRREQRPLLFHIAQPLGVLNQEGQPLRPESEEIRQLAGNMRTWLELHGTPGWEPERINTLGVLIGLQDMLAAVGPDHNPRLEAVLGQDGNLQPALIDLKRMGPHFAIVGPPLAGKTTTLYNWLLSLADRYNPTEVMFVLIDFQRRTFEYGGERSFADLPHVLATLSEPEQLHDLVLKLKHESMNLATNIFKRELFVFIDNYDDFSEEVETKHELVRELAGLARRYGRDGLHFVISGSLDGASDELAKRVKSSNFGLGLRRGSALETLGVMRLPTGLDTRELPVGRGYIVKSGQPSVIQIATPYQESGADAEEDFDSDDQSKVAHALDRWITDLSAKYPEQQAAWSVVEEEATVAETASSGDSAQRDRMLELLRTGMLYELKHLQASDGLAATGNGHTENGDGVATDGTEQATDADGQPVEGNGHVPLVMEQLLQVQVSSWNNEAVLEKMLKELWVNQQRLNGIPTEVIDSLAAGMDLNAIMMMLEDTFQSDSAAVA